MFVDQWNSKGARNFLICSSLKYFSKEIPEEMCNGPSPPLADIVLSRFFLSGFPSRFKMRILGRDFYTLIKNASFSAPTDVGSHNPPPFGAQ